VLKENIGQMNSVNVETKIVNPLMGEAISLPSYATDGSAAIDLRACLKEQIGIQPGETVLVGSGIAINIKDPNIVGIIVPRSGLGIKKGIVLANTIGVIDSDYQGEIKIGLFNRSQNQYLVKPGERICQMLFMPVINATLKLVQEFSNATYRGSGGFGHTGRD
jgi:dUTP pyrophosphatase